MFKKSIISMTAGVLACIATAVPATATGLDNHSLLDAPNFMTVELKDPMADTVESHDRASMELVARLIEAANRHLGTRYRRGGKNPGGFDCSGFTSYIFRQFGVNLSASSRAQFGQGTSVDTDDVQPGDLLFFKGSRSRSIGHVAIAIDNDPDTGDITFIHAAVKGGIRIDRVSQPYYNKRFVGARRVID